MLNLHGFCLLCHLPRFHAQLLRVFPLDSYRNHPFSYTKTPGHDGFFQLQNHPNYWLQAAKQLNDFKRSGNTQAVELVGVGGNLELKCRCVVEYSQNILEIKERILESMEGRVDLRLPHWSDAQPCQCCGKVVKPGSDLASVAETKLQPPCVSFAKRLTVANGIHRIKVTVGCCTSTNASCVLHFPRLCALQLFTFTRSCGPERRTTPTSGPQQPCS